MAKGMGYAVRFWSRCSALWLGLRGPVARAEGRAESPHRRSKVYAEAERLKRQIAESGYRPCPEHAHRVAVERLSALGALLLVLGCHQLSPKMQDAKSLFQCRANVLTPYVSDVFDAANLVLDIAKGAADLSRTLAALGWAQADIVKAESELDVCDEPPLQALPPAYGDKVL